MLIRLYYRLNKTYESESVDKFNTLSLFTALYFGVYTVDNIHFNNQKITLMNLMIHFCDNND